MSEFLDLSKFTKQEKLGQGAFGKVYKVDENSTENTYAAKISLTKLQKSDITLITDLKREVSILSQLNHPSVLKFIGYSPIDFKHESYPVIITEYSSNGSLKDIIDLQRDLKSPSIWTDTKKLINIYGIASAMAYLHAYSIIHRDLKPANILEDDKFFPKIADFGLSKINENFSSRGQSAVGFKGTPIYCAPEVWLKNEYSKAGDVYSFSIIVYELLTLDEPFENLNFFTLYSKIVTKGERPEFKYPIPLCYRDLITRCWSPDPNARPTFQDIVKELRTNKEFITDTIDESEFYEYIDNIDYIGSSFDPNKKLKLNISTKETNYKTKDKIKEESEDESEEESEDESEDKIKEESEDKPKLKVRQESEDESEGEIKNKVKEETGTVNTEIISVGKFNSLPLDQQEIVISNIIERMSNISSGREVNNIKNLLIYMLKFEFNKNNHYLSINSEDDEDSIDEIMREGFKISLSHAAIEMMNDKPTFEMKELNEYLRYFRKVSIELLYPSATFDKNYESILKLNNETEERIEVNIFIDGILKTDMKFRNDNKIQTVRLGQDVKEISGEELESKTSIEGGGSFCGCSSLIQIYIPSSVDSIGDYAFYGCSSLTLITIPSSVTKIGDYAFSTCSSLAQISISSSVATIGLNAFALCSSLAQISIPSSVKEIGSKAFHKCTSLTHVTISSSIISINKKTFKGCSSLVRISIPSSVTKISDCAFEGCSSLRRFSIPSSVTEIGDFAFSGCSSLTEITIPSSVTEIGWDIFDRCSSLSEITIPSSVTKIGWNAFKGCSSLRQISIPSSVTEIIHSAFRECSALTKITIPSSVTEICDSVFNGCSSLSQITIPSSVTKIKEFAFSGCSSLTQITIPSSVTEIGESAFSGCSSLTQVMIPSSLTNIGKDAFIQCPKAKICIF
ncbi:hypothetical protein M9Y10_000521 [Tritrichomonas musculus]|uniref:Protein kinase domain-containing protein n=1 Tax=Tritrichomonas musculus TaxID=1915356 RepID=A0ABR2GK58_9EUKA